MEYIIFFAIILAIPLILERKQIANYYSYHRRMARHYEKLALKKTKASFSSMKNPEDKERARRAANHYKKMQKYHMENI